MRKTALMTVAIAFGIVGWSMGFMAVIGLPAWFIFGNLRWYWFAFGTPVLGFGQMIPLGICHMLYEKAMKSESTASATPASTPSKRCLNEFERLQKEVNSIGLDVIAAKVEEDLKDEERSRHSLEVEGLTPRDVVWLVITNAIAGELPTGNHHIYRGVLSMQGKELLTLWSRALTELELTGANTADKTREERAWMARQIKEVG